MSALFRHLRRLRDDRSGLALLEFAFILPIFIVLSLTGAEVTNYIITRMRVSQMALHLADNAARLGVGSLLQAKTIREKDINDMFVGTDLQAGELDIFDKGRVIVTSVEPMANPNTTGKYKMAWSRCKGLTSYTPRYKRAGMSNTTNQNGFGIDEKVKAPDDGATMFIEVYYQYTPLVKTSLSPSTTMTEVASMMVRDRRDLTRIYNAEAVTPSTCT